MHIAVTGNIGAGKTTLTTMLSKHYGWDAQFEDVDHNPYLEDFYADMSKWSFALQIYFLGSRFRQVKEIREGRNELLFAWDKTKSMYIRPWIFCADWKICGRLRWNVFLGWKINYTGQHPEMAMIANRIAFSID